MPDIANSPYTGGYDASGIYAGSDGRYGSTTNSGSSDLSPYEQEILRAYREGAGYQRDELAQRTKQAKDELDYKYASLKAQAKTSREQLELDRWYKQQQMALAQRAQAASEDQFNKTYGLDYAKAETQYLSSPDTMFQARQLRNSANAIMGGGNGYGAYRSGGDMEQPNTPEDFRRLAQGPTGSGGGTSGPGAGSMTNLYAPSGNSTMLPGVANSMQASGGGGADLRLKALKTIGDALPPSSGTGLSARDNSALAAMTAVYHAPGGDDVDQAGAAADQLLAKNPQDFGLGTFESLLPGTRAALGSRMKTKGIYEPDYYAAYARSRPGQGNSLAA